MPYSVQKQTASMLTRDRVRLDADVYRPVGEGEFPVLLMRQPYGRAIASTVVYAHPTWYAAHGYIVVIQDVRGRGTSEGEFKLFAHEIEDGEDAVNWAAALPGSTGQVGMYGFSYQGITQLYAAVSRPPALKVLCPAMVGYDLYSDWAYEGGAFCLQANLSWAIQIAAESARRSNDESNFLALAAAAKNLPLGDRLPANPDLMRELAPDSFYHDWLAHPEPGPYWENLSPKTLLGDVDLPMLHIGGWFDTFLRGTIALYKAMASRSQFRQQLIVGPWAHLPWGRKVGAVDYGPAAVSPCDRLQLRWFDHFLKSPHPELLTEPPITLFEVGSNHWRTFSTWNPYPATPFYLNTDGLAGITDSGSLAPPPPAPLPDFLIHDPWRPVPALGGHAAYPCGSFDRAALDGRSDILTYTTAALPEALHLVGEITARLNCTADAPSFDLCVVLSEVQPNGSVYNLSQGYVRVDRAAESGAIAIALQPICAQIRSGHALRLSLSAACFPAYSVNPGTGSLPQETRLIEQQIITLTLQCGGDAPSQILLPVQNGTDSQIRSQTTSLLK